MCIEIQYFKNPAKYLVGIPFVSPLFNFLSVQSVSIMWSVYCTIRFCFALNKYTVVFQFIFI